MSGLWAFLAECLRAGQPAARVRVEAIEGSAPREPGAALVLRADGAFRGTIGGGTLEWDAIAEAQAALAAHPGGHGEVQTRLLGPDLGQCCGGRVSLRREVFAPADLDWIEPLARLEARGESVALVLVPDRCGLFRRRPARSGEPAAEMLGEARSPLLLFGAGHVGRAIVLALAPLPFRLRWIDPRADAFPGSCPGNAIPVVTDVPEAEIRSAEAGCAVLVLTHSHALDYALVDAALRRSDLGPVGLIGSATKRARFLSRVERAQLGEAARARLICPIGRPELGKAPPLVAAGVATQLLEWRLAAAKQERLRHAG